MIYLIQEVHFDYTENNTASAEFIVDVGFTSSKENVEKYIAKNELTTKKQWNGEYYPYYKITKIEELTIN